VEAALRRVGWRRSREKRGGGACDVFVVFKSVFILLMN
jgi:hypothetical protein